MARRPIGAVTRLSPTPSPLSSTPQGATSGAGRPGRAGGGPTPRRPSGVRGRGRATAGGGRRVAARMGDGRLRVGGPMGLAVGGARLLTPDIDVVVHRE